MKATKQMKSSTTKEKSAGTSILQGSFPSNSKKKHKTRFLANESEPLVFLPPSPGESMAKYSIPIPSENKPDMIDEVQMLKDITDHLNELVQTMEHVYARKVEQKEEEEEEEKEKEKEKEKGKESSVESVEDMTTFLLYFSSVATQLETACEEEKQILESLLKWFRKLVQQMEELGEDELIPDWQLPVADKDITHNIAKLVQHFQKLEELKGRVQDLPKSIQIPAVKQEKKKRASPVPSSHRDPKSILEDLVMKHGTEDVVSMAHAFEDDLTPQTVEAMSARILDIMKVFERQTNKLQRISNEQDVLEGKYQKIQNEYQLLVEEKQIMENELQKMREAEKLGKEKIIPESRKRFLSKLERKQTTENGEVSSPSLQAAGEARTESLIQSKKESENQKMKEDLIKAQENLHILEQEKKNLEEKLQKALEESVKANRRFTKPVTPSNVQDMHVIYPEADEEDAGTDMKINGKDLSKKSKFPTKSKSKGEDRTLSRHKSSSETDKSVPKLPAIDTGKKTGELLSRKTPTETEKNQEDVISQLKDFKLEKKVLTDKENSKDYEISANKLKENILVQERDQLHKAKESADVMEETPNLHFSHSEYEMVQHATHSTDRGPVSLLPVKNKEESKGKKTQTEEKSETLLKLDPKGSTKPKKAAEARKENVMIKSTGKETHSTAVSDLSQLHKVQEEPPMDNSSDKSLPRALDQLISAKQKEISPEIPQTKEAQSDTTLKSSIQEDSSVLTYENPPFPSTLIPKVQVPFKDLLPSHAIFSADFAKIKEESQKSSSSPIEMTPTTISSKILEEVSAAFIPNNKISAMLSSVKEEWGFLGDIQKPLEDHKEEHPLLKEKAAQENSQGLLKDYKTVLPSEKTLPRIYKEAVGIKENEIEDLPDKKRHPFADDVADLKDMYETETLATLLPEPSRTLEDLSDTERLLLNQLENLSEMQQAQTLVLDEAGRNIEDLADTERLLLINQLENLNEIQKAQTLVLEEVGQNIEVDINELSEERRLLLTSLKSNLKDLQQAETLAASQPGSKYGNGSKINDLTNKKEVSFAKPEVNLKDLQQAQVSEAGKEKLSEKEKLQLPDFQKAVSQPSNWQIPMSVSSFVGLQPTLGEVSGNKMLYLEKKKLLPARQPVNNKSLQLENTLSALRPQDQNSKNEMEQTALRKRLLYANLPSVFPYMFPEPDLPPLQLSLNNLTKNENQELLDKERLLFTSQQFIPEYVSQAQALAQIQLQQNMIGMEAQKLPDTEIHHKKTVTKSSISHNKDLGKGVLMSLQDRDKELLCISGKGYSVLSSRSSELKKDPKC